MKSLVIAALLLDPIASHAGGGHCTGSSGGTSGESTSNSSSNTGVMYGGYFGATARHGYTYPSEIGGCEDNTDVVGYRHCTKFGAWATNTRLPRMFVEVGSYMRRFGSGLDGGTGTVTHGSETFTYRTVMPTTTGESRSDLATSAALRFGFGLPHHLYSGVEVELGGLVAPARASAEMMSTGVFGGPEIQQGRGMLLGAVGVAGVRGDINIGTLALEAAGGVRNVSYKFDSVYHTCEETTSVDITRAVVEARARAELWAGPWFTFGATLGANLLAKNDWLAGLYLGIHNRAYDGAH